MKYYNIDENIAGTGHGMAHMSDYVPRYGAWQRQLTQSAENAARAADAAWAAAAERKWQINNVIEVLDGLEEEAEQ